MFAFRRLEYKPRIRYKHVMVDTGTITLSAITNHSEKHTCTNMLLPYLLEISRARVRLKTYM